MGWEIWGPRSHVPPLRDSAAPSRRGGGWGAEWGHARRRQRLRQVSASQPIPVPARHLRGDRLPRHGRAPGSSARPAQPVPAAPAPRPLGARAPRSALRARRSPCPPPSPLSARPGSASVSWGRSRSGERDGGYRAPPWGLPRSALARPPRRAPPACPALPALPAPSPRGAPPPPCPSLGARRGGGGAKVEVIAPIPQGGAWWHPATPGVGTSYVACHPH